MKLFCRLLIISTSIVFFFASVSSILAFSPKDTFDWNYSSSRESVLGVAIEAENTLPDSFSATKVPSACEDPSVNYLFKFDTNFTPDNPLYFLKSIDEKAKLALTLDQGKREEVRLCYAKQRLTELEKLTTANKNQNIAGMAASYDNFISKVASGLEELKKQGKDVTALSSLLDAEAARHKLFLEELKFELPSEAEKGIDTAVMASEKASDTVADVSGKPAVPQDVIARLQALKAQGLLTSEEVQTLIAASSRKDAREKLRKYTDANLIPEADFSKMDESAKNFFPEEFARKMEMEKFQELKNSETQKPDETTIKKLQEFAKSYKPGETVPQDLRRWWGPMVRLEDLQKTTRVDLIDPEIFKNRPEDQQKYREIVERYKPKAEDVEYINKLVGENPNVLNDPAFARIKSFADKFGTVESNTPKAFPAQNCGGNTHWASIPFMPGGGYCVPNYEYPAIDTKDSKAINACPPDYHRNSAESPCYPNNPNMGFGGGDLPSAGDCPAGYKWKEERNSPRGGYCSIEFASTGGGFPSPVSVPAYCPAGKMFVDGKCQNYNPVPNEGCKEGYWNGQKCVVMKDCGAGKYQDYNGDCKSSEEQYQNYLNKCKDKQASAGGCGSGYWDMESCSCKESRGGPYPTPDTNKSCPPGYKAEPLPQSGFRCVPEGGGGGPYPTGPNPTGGGGSTTGGWRGGGGSQEEACKRGTNCEWKGTYCVCNASTGSYNPEDNCKKTPNCTWSNGSCTCQSQSYSNNMAENCGKTPGCTWQNNYCNCSGSSGSSGGSAQPAGPSNCGSGYFWNGSYCAPNNQTPQPSSASQPTNSPQPSASAPEPTQPPSTPAPQTESQPPPSPESPPPTLPE